MYGGFMENIKELAMESILGTGDVKAGLLFPILAGLLFLTF
jgi:hypothetical protein